MSDNLRRDARRNRERILAAAQRRVDAGEGDVPLNVIAAEAGVGVGTVYRHFPTQLELLAAMVHPSLVELQTTMEELAEQGRPDAVEEAFKAAVRVFAERPEALVVVSSGETAQHEASASLATITTVLDRLIDDAVLAGRLRPDVTVEVLQHLVCAVDYAARLASDPKTARTVHTEIALHGLHAR
ncbi:TetR/AcrR family transcriptional regulator [Desertihabitans brevis]|uniref:TetR/AcrR family transcriptional regulator n=1 Tax=Desertihabitans brevis TaxID=2268447 RepID=A0A367YXE3_9ACTN|nr:TetR/AcrR family transcriptional regulator [Desertihabitans brevis]RCK70566.1 TetR/AcrR family transcriptional regulator [Desertihabitans brevis]